MGNQTSQITSIGLDVILTELYEHDRLKYEKTLGHGIFSKSIQCQSLLEFKTLSCKLINLPQTDEKDSKSMNTKRLLERYQTETSLIESIPNVHKVSKMIVHDDWVILIRNFIASNLYDRISTRPFLSFLEKKWIVYQLLSCIEQCHSLGVFHGDIKTENILVTSWNWLYITDFASFKPTFVPEDNPADFSFFYDSSLRRNCYIAPERFFNPSSHLETYAYGHSLDERMDVFSIGCVVAELFLEKSVFTLSQLLRYRLGEYEVELQDVENEQIRKLILDMIQHDPLKRKSLKEYLSEFKEFDFCYDYHKKLSTIGISKRVKAIYKDRAIIMSDPVSAPILVSVVFSALRHLNTSKLLIQALELILLFASKVDDALILDRFIPYVCYTFHNPDPNVVAYAVYVVHELLSKVEHLKYVIDVDLYSEYLIPTLGSLLKNNNDVLVKNTIAATLPSLMKISKKFLELGNSAEQKDAEDKQFLSSYDSRLIDLYEGYHELVVNLLTETQELITAKLILIENVLDLCTFFGRNRSNEMVLSFLVTFANDKNRYLRRSFALALGKIALFVGWQSFEQYFLPLIKQTLTDEEEIVIDACIETLSYLVPFVPNSKALHEMLQIVAPFLLHYNGNIRERAVDFVCKIKTEFLELYCNIWPIISPYLDRMILTNDRANILANLKKPISKAEFDNGVKLISLDQNSVFPDEANSIVLNQFRKIMVKISKAVKNPEELEPDFSYVQPKIPHKLKETVSIASSSNGELYPFSDSTQGSFYHNWKPKGDLIANLNEHQAFVTHSIVSPDSRFFITADSKGYLKLWDSRKLIKSVTDHSRLSYRKYKKPVTSICWCSGYKFAVAYQTRIVEILKVSFKVINYAIKYESIQRVHVIDLSEFGESVYSTFISYNGRLYISTNQNSILKFDNELSKVADIDPSYGMITAFIVDKEKNSWIILGTNIGYVLLYDLRFNLIVKEWKEPFGRINKIVQNNNEVLIVGKEASIYALSGDFVSKIETSGEVLDCLVQGELSLLAYRNRRIATFDGSFVAEHVDAVRSVNLLTYPFPMIISTGNDYHVKVWK